MRMSGEAAGDAMCRALAIAAALIVVSLVAASAVSVIDRNNRATYARMEAETINDPPGYGAPR